MFSDIEKEYKKGLQEKRFSVFYWPKATILVTLALCLDLMLNINRWLVYGCLVAILLALVVFFFAGEFYRAHNAIEGVRKGKGLAAKTVAYFAADDTARINHLVLDLARHDIRTKRDLEITLNYFQARLPANTRPNLLEWILTVLITFSSIVIVTYDDSVGTISLHRLYSVVGSALVVALIILTPLILAKLISAGISSSRNKIDTVLVEDLAYIYVHFDTYQKILEHEPGDAAQRKTIAPKPVQHQLKSSK